MTLLSWCFYHDMYWDHMEAILTNYQLKEILGQGSVSDVYLAHHESQGTVAVKILKNFLRNDEEVLNRVQKETEILALLKDERIVKILSTSTTQDGRPCIIQEYVDGKNLATLLQEQSSAQPSPIIGCIIVSEILLGLEEAHRNGIIHRDLKPENIMLTSDGRIKITDFGIAKNIYSEEATRPGIIIGSPAYMSPEQVHNSKVDERSDLFSLGVILFKYATNHLPHMGQNYAATVNKILNEEHVNPVKLNSRLHPSLVKIIRKALRKNPEERYQKAYEFRFDLLKLLEELSIVKHKQELRNYYEQKDYLKNFTDDRLLSTLITRAETALNQGETTEAQKFIQQAINIHPNDQKTRALLKKANQKSFFNKRTAALLLILLIGGTGIYFGTHVSSPSTETKKIAAIEKVESKTEPVQVDEVKAVLAAPIPVKTEEKVEEKKIESIKASPAKKLIEEIKRAETKPVIKPTTVKFITDDDTFVYIDDQIINKRNKPFKVAAGKHRIKLYKEGFNPINSEINCPEGELTTVNTTSGGNK